ncbi:MAG: STAS domain-containing protein [Bryobacteraceae bacterium]
MLRITVQESNETWRLTLSGKLAGAWVAETANAWRSAPRSGKQIEVDLNEVTGIDAAGRSLLVSMHQAGARLQATGVENSALISEIRTSRGKRPMRPLATNRSNTNTPNQKRRKK